MIARLRVWLRRLLRPRAVERALDDELAACVELLAAEYRRAGFAADEARRRALVDLGGLESVKAGVCDATAIAPFEGLGADVRQALRALRRARSLSAAVILMVAAGVGLSAACFGVVDVLIVRPLDLVRDPDRVVSIPAARNYVQFQDLAAALTTTDVAAYADQTLSTGEGPGASTVHTECVTPGYFDVLGVSPMIGRTFAADESRPGDRPVVLIAHEYWSRAFGRDPVALGRVLDLAGKRFTVVGVLPEGFRGVGLDPIDAWIALPVSPAACSFSGSNLLASSHGMWLWTIGRMRPDVTFERARADVAAVVRSSPDWSADRKRQTTVEPIAEARRDGDGVHGETNVGAWLAGGAAAVLVLCSAGVAALLLIHAFDRRREIAIRRQLGATPARLFRQILTEHIVLLAAGTTGAAIVAAWVWTACVRYFPALAGRPFFDRRTTVLLLATALGSGAFACVIPAAQVARRRWRDVMGTGSTGAPASGRARFRWALLVTQSSLALMLVVAASLFVQSVRNAKTNVGYDVDRLVVATMDLPHAGIRRDADARALFDAVLDRARHVPDVESASLATAAPLGSLGLSSHYLAFPSSSPTHRVLIVSFVSPGYFTTVGTRIVRGRPFAPTDDEAGTRVAIVDERVAADGWPGDPLIGRCVTEIAPAGSGCAQIVGVSETRRLLDLARSDGEIFFPIAQAPRDVVPQVIFVRPRTSPAASLAVITAAIQGATPNMPAVSVRPLAALADDQARSWRAGATMFGLFGVIAVALMGIGIYSTLAFLTRQRTKEIGVRVALGAQPTRVLILIARQAVIPLGVGWLMGVVGARAASGLIRNRLFDVAPTDPRAFVIGSVVLLLAAAMGMAAPVIRALRVDPAVALRQE